jgi:predicted dehydrogenase
MVRVGILGLGGMGNMHFGCYDAVHGAEVLAICDVQEERLEPGESSLEINVGEGGARIDPDRHRLYSDPDELIADPDVDMLDICLPTFLHAEYCIKGLEAGKHVLCEKPMALTHAECEQVLGAAKEAPGKLMIAHCLRFFPAYEYLNETVEAGRLGMLLALSMWRGGSPPQWSWEGWLLDAERSGGFILDLHIHDADFVHYLLGRPRAVFCTGVRGPSGGLDVVETQYVFDGKLAVIAGANMTLPQGFGFEAAFTASFERGCLRFNTTHPHGLMEVTDQGARHPELPEKSGYQEEIAYFVDCIAHDEMPAVVTPESSAFSVRLVEAERESAETGHVVELD